MEFWDYRTAGLQQELKNQKSNQKSNDLKSLYFSGPLQHEVHRDGLHALQRLRPLSA